MTKKTDKLSKTHKVLKVRGGYFMSDAWRNYRKTELKGDRIEIVMISLSVQKCTREVCIKSKNLR